MAVSDLTVLARRDGAIPAIQEAPSAGGQSGPRLRGRLLVPATSGLGKVRTWIPMVETACGQVLSFEQPFEVQKAKQKMLELLSHAREAGYEVTRQSYHTFDV